MDAIAFDRAGPETGPYVIVVRRWADGCGPAKWQTFARKRKRVVAPHMSISGYGQ